MRTSTVDKIIITFAGVITADFLTRYHKAALKAAYTMGEEMGKQEAANVVYDNLVKTLNEQIDEQKASKNKVES